MRIVIDIDHTLSDSTPRDNLLSHSRYDCQGLQGAMTQEDWRRYHEKCDEDIPNSSVLSLVRTFAHSSHTILLATARPQAVRAKTVLWLERYNCPYAHLLMRNTEHDWMSSPYLKMKLLSELYGKGWPSKIDLIIDDHPGVCREFGRRGIPSMQFTIGDDSPYNPQGDYNIKSLLKDKEKA